jgi:hypothetical protein
MHPPRRNRTTEPQGFADRLVDWLLTHCPFTTLTVLTVLVIGPTLAPFPDPMVIAVPVVIADIAFLVMRRWASEPSVRHRTSQ